MKLNFSSKQDRRQGVALIVVLGFLSLMIMMALAFLTQARVERMVAGASLEGMRTRQLAQTAVAAAMQDYLNALKDVPQNDPVHDVFLSGDGRASMSHHYSGMEIGDARLLNGKVEDWLTDEQLDAALNGSVDDDVANAEWIWVRQQPGARSRILGRYAYVCFDMSGMVDANLLGAVFSDDPNTNLWHGGWATGRSNVRRMMFDGMLAEPQVSFVRQAKLAGHRKNWRGFDSPAALRNLTDGVVVTGSSDKTRWQGVGIAENEVGGIEPKGLSCYSYAVTHQGAGAMKKLLCQANFYTNDLFCTNSIFLMGGTNRAIYKALRDYENPTMVPVGTDYPSVKNVPMFNEIGVRVSLKAEDYVDGETGMDASNYSLILELKPEFWYPFPSTDNSPGKLGSLAVKVPSIGCGGSASGTEDIWVRVALGPSSGAASHGVRSTGPILPDELPVTPIVGDPYVVDAGEDGAMVFEVPLLATGGGPLPRDLSLHVRLVRLNASLVLHHDNRPVDTTPEDGFGFVLEGIVPKGSFTPWTSMAVSDPRLNHDRHQWSIEDPHSFNKVNEATKDALAAIPGVTPGKYFYCRNGMMETPAEFGYIPTGEPWKTLNIFSEAGTLFMDRLICNQGMYDVLVDKNKGNGAYFTNGTINPYTRHTNVLSAAFFGLDHREVPNMSGSTNHIGAGRAKELAEGVMTLQRRNGHAGWATVLNDPGLVSSLNYNERIALLRNTWGLFDESDRLFIVLVIAQSIKEGERSAGVGNWDPDEDMITGERRAVALCWMDASAEGSAETLTQEMNIIMFQYLNE
ncbi:MAG: hypothetical protein GX803_04240 [Lentisphaerae bacterium]|jgi:hypothetical protein|nr:hypothetical protein [Lentisphaerota bacterium]